MSYSIISIDHSIKLAITASIKRFEFKRYDVDNDQLVDALLTDLFADLFPHNPSLVSPDFTPTVQLPVILPTTTTTTTTNAKKEPKKRVPKTKVSPIPEEPPVEVESSTPAPAPEKKERKKPGPKPQTDVPQNIKKLNPTQVKKLEKAAPGTDIKQFIDFLNAMTPDEYKAKVIDDHIQDFVKPAGEESESGYTDSECIEVEYNGKMYFVNPDTRVVYQANNEHVNVKVGIVGALEFADMEIPSEDDE